MGFKISKGKVYYTHKKKKKPNYTAISRRLDAERKREERERAKQLKMLDKRAERCKRTKTYYQKSTNTYEAIRPYEPPTNTYWDNKLRRYIEIKRPDNCPYCKAKLDGDSCRLCGWKYERETKIKEKMSRHISSSIKREVWRRDNGKCVECGSQERLEYDHIIPFSKGGSNTARNIQILCERCNRTKHNKIK